MSDSNATKSNGHPIDCDCSACRVLGHFSGEVEVVDIDARPSADEITETMELAAWLGFQPAVHGDYGVITRPSVQIHNHLYPRFFRPRTSREDCARAHPVLRKRGFATAYRMHLMQVLGAPSCTCVPTDLVTPKVAEHLMFATSEQQFQALLRVAREYPRSDG